MKSMLFQMCRDLYDPGRKVLHLFRVCWDKIKEVDCFHLSLFHIARGLFISPGPV